LRIELVLLSIGVEGVLPQPLYYETEVLRMLLGSLTIDEDVIQVDYAEFIKIAYKGLVNIGLKRR
jgi:hypothetical protein